MILTCFDFITSMYTSSVCPQLCFWLCHCWAQLGVSCVLLQAVLCSVQHHQQQQICCSAPATSKYVHSCCASAWDDMALWCCEHSATDDCCFCYCY
jgi:hypothetical protein